LKAEPHVIDAAAHQHWSAEALWEQLDPLLPGISVEVVARTDSTNARLIERARVSGGRRDQPITTPGELEQHTADEVPSPRGRRSGDTQPCLLVAEQQTRGRGRTGRNWQSTPGRSLTFSLALALEPPDWAGLSLAVGVALAEALDPLAGDAAPRIGLKWPNDLWLLDDAVVGRKLGGVLIETVAVGARRMAVVGVGLNVMPQDTRDLSSGFASLQELDAEATPPAALLRIATPLAHALLHYERNGFAVFAPAFARRDLLRGRQVRTTAPEVPQGLVHGVADDGALLVEAAGRVHRILSGEVSVRLPGQAAAGAQQGA
jgi:BirA family transcriptional regulator, biotin operon repressor / biotin---[acetyl-CoA-carboxylase] ligase